MNPCPSAVRRDWRISCRGWRAGRIQGRAHDGSNIGDRARPRDRSTEPRLWQLDGRPEHRCGCVSEEAPQQARPQGATAYVRAHLRTIIATLAALAIIVPLAVMWQDSRMPSSLLIGRTCTGWTIAHLLRGSQDQTRTGWPLDAEPTPRATQRTG